MEPPAAEKTPAPQLTRFDRLKKNYKGFTKPVEEGEAEELSFSYDDFASAVAETSYSFERNSIVKGQCNVFAQAEPPRILRRFTVLPAAFSTMALGATSP